MNYVWCGKCNLCTVELLEAGQTNKKVTKDCCVQSDLFRQGKLFHTAVEDILASGATSEKAESPPGVQGYMESISHILEDVSAVRAIESTVRHDTLNYLGIADCVARYR